MVNLGENKTIRVGQSVTLDGSGSFDSDGTIIAYEWTEGDIILGTAPTLTNSPLI